MTASSAPHRSLLFCLALLVAVLILPARPAVSADMDTLAAMMREAMVNQEKVCPVIEALDKALAEEPDNVRLLRMRISAYGLLNDPWSAAADMETMTSLRPESTSIQLHRCLHLESMGTPQEELNVCYRKVAELCEAGGDELTSQDYVLVLLLGESPKLEEVRQKLSIEAAGSSLALYLLQMMDDFQRDSYVKKFDPAAVRQCPRNTAKSR